MAFNLMGNTLKYTKLFDFILEMQEINATEKIILSKLMSFESNNLTPRMGNTFLAKKMGLCTRQIRRYLQHLEELQLIIRIQTPEGRIIKLGPTCPTPWTKKSASNGHIRPSKQDDIDHLLDILNKNS